MKVYALMLILPLVLLIGIGNLTPKNYISYGNVTDTYITYLPQRAVGLETAYEYDVNSSRNSTLVVKIANYQNYTDALNVYNYIYGLQSKQVATQIPYPKLNQEFNFSSIESLENYSEFVSFDPPSMENFSTLFMLISNSVVEYYSTGEEVNLLSPPKSMETIVTATNQTMQTTTVIATTTMVVTTIPAPQGGINYSAAYVLFLLAIVLILIAAYAFNRRRIRNSYNP